MTNTGYHMWQYLSLQEFPSTYCRIYLRLLRSLNPSFASHSTTSLGEVLCIWFMFVLIWSDIKYDGGTIQVVQANGFRSLKHDQIHKVLPVVEAQ